MVERGIANALIDLSDGLAGDSAHLAAASGVQIVLDEGRVPVATVAVEVLGPEEALQAALHGGRITNYVSRLQRMQWIHPISKTISALRSRGLGMLGKVVASGSTEVGLSLSL